jgi:choline dehydrogenase-like flavoprotein
MMVIPGITEIRRGRITRRDAMLALPVQQPGESRQQRYDDLTSSQRGFIDATAAEGVSRVEDFNGADPGGVGAYAVNVVDGVRQNNGLVYRRARTRGPRSCSAPASGRRRTRSASHDHEPALAR